MPFSQSSRGALLVRNPVLSSLLLVVAYEALLTLGSFAVSALAPDISGYGQSLSQSLILVLVAAEAVGVLVGTLGWWQRSSGSETEHPHEEKVAA